MALLGELGSNASKSDFLSALYFSNTALRGCHSSFMRTSRSSKREVNLSAGCCVHYHAHANQKTKRCCLHRDLGMWQEIRVHVREELAREGGCSSFFCA